jgi:hypothetical protein
MYVSYRKALPQYHIGRKTFIGELLKLLEFFFGRVDQSGTWQKNNIELCNACTTNYMNCKISIANKVYILFIYLQ